MVGMYIKKQAQQGVPHSRIRVELGFILQAGTFQILNCAQNPRQSQSVQGTELKGGGDTTQKKCIRGGGTQHIFYEQGASRGGGGDTTHTFLMRRTIGVGTPHNIERKT